MPSTNPKNKFSRSNSKSNKYSSSSSLSTRSRRPQVALYDENDRHAYLTGFSARKKAAKAAALERAAERARIEKLEFRRQLREVRMSKIKETIEQQAEWYGVDAFADMENHEVEDKQVNAPRKTVHIMKESLEDVNNDPMNATTTTVTIEPLDVDHSVLMNPSTKRPNRTDRRSQNLQKHHSSTNATSLKPRTGTNTNEYNKRLANKKNKKKKIPYESKATKTIERAKKKSKRDSKSKKR